MKVDNVQKLIECCNKMESILLNNGSTSKYNYNFRQMIKYARALIDANRAEELIPYLNHKSLMIRYEVACILYNSFPEKCHPIIKEVSEMTIATGLPKHLTTIGASASNSLKYGIPKDFP
ncbi:MAG: hypothetical protein IK134_12855 [Oscillospiraceae bacterium]|nr:hypothetical protein [Oscillospiraceae bacterium]